MRHSATFCVLAALLAARGLAAQADSARGDSALARPAGLVSRTTVRGATLRSLLADDPEHALGLVPGVVLRRAETGLAGASVLSIRGGEPGAASVYIDGAPVRFLTLGVTGVALGTGSVEEVSVTTGPPDLSLPDGRNGVIEYVTRAGGGKLAGSVRAATDEAFAGVGFSRFEGSLGGPLPGMGKATWSVGGTLMGQRSHYLGMGTEDITTYLPAGVDTVVGGDTLIAFSPRRAYDWGTDLRAHANVQLAFGRSGSLSVTGVANEVQQRFFPGTFALAPTLYSGSRSLARLVVANWRQTLGSLRGSPLALRINVSIGSNRTAAGLLEVWSEALSRDPGLGITLETLRFTGDDSIPNPLHGQLIRNIRTNSGVRVPFLNQGALANRQSSRGNPYGMESSWPDAGANGPLSLAYETRTDGRWALDWREVSGAHRVTVGGDVQLADISSYTTGSLISLTGLDAYRAKPGRTGVYAMNRFGRGDLRAEVTLRYDHFGSVGLFANTPGRIYTNPAFNSQASSDDTAYTNSLARVMTPGRTRHAVSFRTAVGHDLGPLTAIRVAYGRWVEPAPLELVLHNSNADLDFTSASSAVFGRDLDYGYASLAELGVRRQLATGVVADAAIYRRTRAFYAARIQPFPDPVNPGDVINLNVLTKPDDVVDLGLDVAVNWSATPWLTARAAYSVRQLDVSALVASSVIPVADPTFPTHSFSAAAVARAPAGFLAGFEGSALLRLTSGTWYNRSFAPPGSITPAVDSFGPGSNDRLPWIKRLDLRIQRTLTVGSVQWAFFGEARNLFGWQNILAFFAETGDVVNNSFRAQRLSAEFQNIEIEANNNSALGPNGDITLPADCSGWFDFSTANPANCVALKRAEARFGNGDGLYTLAERTTALHAFFNAFFGAHTFYGSGRSVRLGAEIRW